MINRLGTMDYEFMFGRGTLGSRIVGGDWRSILLN